MSRPSAFSSEEPQQPKRQLQLVVHAGPLAGKGFPISGDTLTFGRDPENNITLDDTQVSRFHARLLLRDDEVIIEDLGSTNGTLVNGTPVTSQHVLQPADIISVGSSVFGVKGFSAPSTVGVTQVSSEPPTFTPAGPVASPSPPKPRPVPPPPSSTEQQGPSRMTFLAIGGIVALIITILLIAGLVAYGLNRGGSTVSEIPQVFITAPSDGSEFRVNQPYTIQATAESRSGVVRMELLVSGLKVNEAVSPIADGQATLTTSFQWTPEAPGTYTLEVRAFTANGLVNAPSSVTVNAVGE
ncbi:MAG: FHA domain-containing protein, partial [Anaerolineae bacterium]|nr:FHA domain-containing protein [Anaerolineae bacterium]